MFNANNILGQLLDSPAKQGFAGGLAGGLLGGAMTSKSGRKMGKKALKYGAVAAVGALAYNAWRNHQAGKAPGSSPAGPGVPGADVPTGATGMAEAPAAVATDLPPAASGFLPPASDTEATNRLGMTLIRAMVAAARADGRLDATETQTILGRLEESDLSAEEKGILVNELSRPVDLDTLVAGVRSPQEAMEVYLASLMAIDVDTPAEKAYLAMLAARLELDEGLVAELHRQVEAA